MTVPLPIVCVVCGRPRDITRPKDVNDYNAMQVIANQPLGWYSGDDGEVCPEDMSSMIRGTPAPPPYVPNEENSVG